MQPKTCERQLCANLKGNGLYMYSATTNRSVFFTYSTYIYVRLTLPSDVHFCSYVSDSICFPLYWICYFILLVRVCRCFCELMMIVVLCVSQWARIQLDFDVRESHSTLCVETCIICTMMSLGSKSLTNTLVLYYTCRMCASAIHCFFNNCKYRAICLLMKFAQTNRFCKNYTVVLECQRTLVIGSTLL